MSQNKDLKVEKIGDSLSRCSIALCVTGGIAAIETPKIARHLRRYGASVKAYATKESQKFIGISALEWATEKEVVNVLSGMSEHICMEDIVLVAPATLNTINKIFSGIADNPVTTLVASAIGQKKEVYLAPTMHESLYNNPFLKKNLANAERYGIKIIEPRISEGKAKIPRAKDIADLIIKDREAER